MMMPMLQSDVILHVIVNFGQYVVRTYVRADDQEDKDEAMTASDSDYLSRFVAPEVTNSSKQSQPGNVWSLGILARDLGLTESAILSINSDQEKDSNRKIETSLNTAKLIDRCLVQRPEDRITMQ